jgi:hypothetical protein
MKTAFFRMMEAADKAESLRWAIRNRNDALQSVRFELDATTLASIPGSAFAYWIQPSVLGLFDTAPRVKDSAQAWVGLQTNEDFRWVRTWWESWTEIVGKASPVPFAKGGSFSSFYADVNLAIRWGHDGYWIKSWKLDQLRQGKITANNSRCWNESHYFRPGITWPSRTQQFGPRVLPSGCIFAHKGPAAFVERNDETEILSLLCVMNSRLFAALVETRLNAADATARSYEVGLIEETPVPLLGPQDAEILAEYARQSWSLRRSLDTKTETSHAFTLPALLQGGRTSLATSVDSWCEHVRAVEEKIVKLQADIDNRCFDLYAISDEDRLAITEGFAADPNENTERSNSGVPPDDGQDDEAEGDEQIAPSDLTADLIAWALGVAFGRFDVRLAIEGADQPRSPNPFDPLPNYSPAMLVNDEGTPPKIAPVAYPITLPGSGILVDDPGHVLDLTSAVRSVFDVVFKAGAEDWWVDSETMLGVRSQGLRHWLSANCFDHHLKRHSKSRRKAPIIWQIALPSSRYSIWLYAHRLSRDTFLLIQNDVVTPKLAIEESHLASLRQESGTDTSAKFGRELEDQEALVSELRDFVTEIGRAAALWRPFLDDGVILSMAPLWRLVPQHKPWQRELRSKWEDLVAGKYDWSQVAMHLWPERVVPKCATDRSLAIAHGLEDNFWFEDEDGKWKSYEKPKQSVDVLVRERTSSAVKAALKSLLEAPDAAGSAKRTRRSRVA